MNFNCIIQSLKIRKNTYLAIFSDIFNFPESGLDHFKRELRGNAVDKDKPMARLDGQSSHCWELEQTKL